MMATLLLGKEQASILHKLGSQEILDRLDSLDGILLGGRTNSGAHVNETTAMRYAAVYTAVRILSEVIAMMPCHLLLADDKGNVQKATDHPTFNVLYRNTNGYQTAFEFWRHVMVCLLLRGNFFGYITRNGNNQAAEIVPIDGSRLKITLNSDSTLSYEYNPKSGRAPFTLRPDEIMHIRALGSDGIMGQAPITQAREAIGIGMQAEVHAAKMWSNGAKLGVVLQHPEIVSEEVAARLVRSFDNTFSGAENSNKTVLLEEGITIEKVGMTAEDAQFLDQRKYQRSEVLAIFGVPPHMAGDTEKTTSWGTGIEQQTIGFVTFVLMPWLVNIEQCIYRDVLTRKEKKQYYAKFNSDAIIRGDLLSRYKAHEIGIKAGFLNRNEVRAMENRNSEPGLDKFLEPKTGPSAPDPAADPANPDDSGDTKP
jgi:HK97 family phage portal protein